MLPKIALGWKDWELDKYTCFLGLRNNNCILKKSHEEITIIFQNKKVPFTKF